jgi:alpha/beta superfamily hydrolase
MPSRAQKGDALADPVREIAGPAGPLEVLIDTPPGTPRAAVVFAHPLPIEGGTMHTKVVFQGAKALARIGCAVLRFNFRGVGRSAGAWDEGRGEKDDYRAALDFFAGRYPDTELWAAGFSFGSYIAMTCGAEDDRVCALIGIAPPVNRYDYGVVKATLKPKFIVHGERDELIPLKAVREFYARLQEPKELIEIDRANHLFEGQAGEVGDTLEDLLMDFTCTKL